jgi:DNA mismatch repair protein MutS
LASSARRAAPSTTVRETPVRRQYQRLREQYPDCILLFQLGDFFESFEDDARTVAQVCGITLTSRELGKGDRVALAGVPVTRLEHYLARLLEAGLHVAVAEQMTPPGSGLVERAVTRVVTPGTLAEPSLLHERENSYLAAVVRGRSGIGLAYADVTTGEFAATELVGDGAEMRLRVELERLGPAEVLVPEGEEPEVPRIGHMTICQPWRFHERAATERLCAHFGVLSLEGFGCAAQPLAVGAAGAIVSYLQENNSRLLPNLSGLRTYSTAVGMVLDGYTRRNLELLRSGRTGRVEGSLLAVLDRARTPMGGRLLRRWVAQPLLDVAEIDTRLDAVEGFVGSVELRARVRSLLTRVGDLERQLGRMTQGVATPRELLDFAESLRMASELRDLVRQTIAPPDPITARLGELDACPEVVELVRRAIAPPHSGRKIKAGYSADLDALLSGISEGRRLIADLERAERERTGIRSLKVGYNKVFGYYLEVTRPHLAAVPSTYQRRQTLVAAERFITPDLKDHETRILHAEERVDELEREVYENLLRQITAYGGRIRRLADALAEIDVFAALADLADERDYHRPVVDLGDEIQLTAARHPVVEARLEPGAFIPNDCHLSAAECQVMVLTGPNMAGKSTYLRQVALVVLLAQMGSFVPAQSARIGLVDRIFTRVGAQDDIAAGASTFMVEMMEAASILRHATGRSLVVLDEIGRGTSTFDGLSIARAVVEEVHERIGARTLFATHFHELAALADELDHVRVFNSAVAEEGNDIVFLRRVVPGGADRSYGIQVARLAGLPSTVTYRAEQILRDLESRGTLAPTYRDRRARPQQLALDGIDLGCEAPADLLEELLALDPANLTPLEALNKLYEIQRRAGKG